MENKDFVHCHVHSEYSSFDGLAPIKKLAFQARKMGFKALALTDHGTMGGLIQFVNACEAKKDKAGKEIEYPIIKPLLGSEFYMSESHLYHSKVEQPRGRRSNHHLIVIAKNWKGYRNLACLSNTSWLDGFYMDPRIDFDLLSKHHEGLIVSSACLAGVINSNLMYDKYENAKKIAAIFKDIFGEDFFLEIMYHGIRMEMDIVPDVIKIGKELDIPVICSNDVHYVTKPQAESQEVFMCMSTNKCLKDPQRLRFSYDEFYLKSANEMERLFGHIPQVLSNTKALADRVDWADIKRNMFGGMRLPIFEIKEYKKAEEVSNYIKNVIYQDRTISNKFDKPYSYLVYLAFKGMKKLNWSNSEPHKAALQKELEDIFIAWQNNGYDFATYLLIVEDIINYADENDIMYGPGRGSGYGSVLLRCLGITYGIDPLEFGLLWERFLGFDDKRYIHEKDFGFSNEDNVVVIDEKDRDVEDDLGGVDRY